MNKKLKVTLYTALVMSVLCAGTVSARQLRTQASVFPVCRGTCSATKPCLGGCICQNFGGTTSACVRDPGPARPKTHEPEPR